MASSTLLSRWLARSDDPRTMAKDPRGETSWRDAVAAADGVADALLDGRRSLEGERIALLVSPGADFVISMFGILRASGCLVVLSPVHPPPETTYFCADAAVRTVIASPDLAPPPSSPGTDGGTLPGANPTIDNPSSAANGNNVVVGGCSMAGTPDIAPVALLLVALALRGSRRSPTA